MIKTCCNRQGCCSCSSEEKSCCKGEGSCNCKEGQEGTCRCKKTGCGHEMQIINARNLDNRMKRSTNTKVINVLEKKYFDDCHIKGSINVPFNELEEKAPSWNKDTEIIVYCAHKQCSASSQAYNILRKLGFKNLWAYEDGMKDWLVRRFESEGACQMSYLK